MNILREQIKNELFHLLGYYSKYYFRQFAECENLYEESKGHICLFHLFNLFENLTKTVLNDFESTFYNLNIKLNEVDLINEKELHFLNNTETGIRKIRNILAHANLSKYDLKIENEDKTYPFTENETCLILYQNLSDIVSGLMIKLIKNDLLIELDINLDKDIENLNFSFVTRTPEDLMRFKGIPLNPEWEKLDESTKYRLVENSPDVFALTEIFKNLRL